MKTNSGKQNIWMGLTRTSGTRWQEHVISAGIINFQVDIGFPSSNQPFSMIIEATLGAREIGNIAIDDVSFTPECKLVLIPIDSTMFL